jgi:hypothetical protein
MNKETNLKTDDEKAYEKFYSWVTKANANLEETLGQSSPLKMQDLVSNFPQQLKNEEFKTLLKKSFKSMEQQKQIELLQDIRNLLIYLP